MSLLSNFLAAMTYKVGWRFSEKEFLGTPYLSVRCTAQDVECPDSLTEVWNEESVPRLQDNMEAASFVRGLIMRTEEHEFKEWFKHDGVNMFDPHPHPNKVLLGNVLSDRPAITLLQFLDKMTYKKGWEFKVRGPSESAMYGLSGLSNLLILHEVKDATGKIESSYPVVVQQSFKIPETVDWPVQGWASFMKECIMALETHEFKEWFKLDGHCIYDPHPEMRPMMIDSALLKSATLDVTNEIFKSATFMNRFAIDQKKGLSIGMLNIA